MQAEIEAEIETLIGDGVGSEIDFEAVEMAARRQALRLAARAGKQADGTARTREVKLCTVWSAETRDPERGTPVRDEGSVSYSAAIESAAQRDTDDRPSAFAERVQREAKRRGFDRAMRRVVVGDGAPWIWNLADERFPDAIQIVDLFHVKQHLSDVANSNSHYKQH